MGIDSHMLQSLPICTLAGVVDLPDGPIMCYFYQYAYHANGHTIHSKVQLMDYNNAVDDSPIKLGGTQKIVTPCGITMPLDVIRGIAYLKLRRPTDDELATLEPVHMTRDEAWDPSKYDSAPSADEANRSLTLLWNLRPLILNSWLIATTSLHLGCLFRFRRNEFESRKVKKFRSDSKFR